MLFKDCYRLYHIRRLWYVIRWLLSVYIDFYHCCFNRFVAIKRIWWWMGETRIRDLSLTSLTLCHHSPLIRLPTTQLNQAITSRIPDFTETTRWERLPTGIQHRRLHSQHPISIYKKANQSGVGNVHKFQKKKLSRLPVNKIEFGIFVLWQE